MTRKHGGRVLHGLAVGAVLIGVFAATPAGNAVAGDPKPNYPVPYRFLPTAAVAGASGPDTPPPGANNWRCKPSKAHPNPVILVHGLLANQTDNWQTFAPLLANHGYCVFALTYGNNLSTERPLSYFGGLIPMEQSARVLGAFVDKVRAATRAAKVDLLGHSEGATMPYWYLKFEGGASKVARMVGLAPAVHGTALFGPELVGVLAKTFGLSPAESALVSPACASCLQLRPGSDWMHRLAANGIAVRGVTYTQILTRYDELVLPYTSGIVVAPNSTNIIVQDLCALDFADHLEIGADPVTARVVLNALDPAHAQPVPCMPVAPVVGT